MNLNSNKPQRKRKLPSFISPAELFAKANSAPLHSRLIPGAPAVGQQHTAATFGGPAVGDVIYFESSLRGGGEMGYAGGRDGRHLRRKMDTPTEFEVVAMLIKLEGYQ